VSRPRLARAVVTAALVVGALSQTGCWRECQKQKPLQDRVYESFSSLGDLNPQDVMVVTVLDGVVSIKWTLEDGSTRTVDYTPAPLSLEGQTHDWTWWQDTGVSRTQDTSTESVPAASFAASSPSTGSASSPRPRARK